MEDFWEERLIERENDGLEMFDDEADGDAFSRWVLEQVSQPSSSLRADRH